MRCVLAGISLVLLATFGARAAAAEPDTSAPAALQALKVRLVGPAAGGRISRVSGVPGDPLTYYAATASGGVWKSADGGHVWKPIFDKESTASIGSIAVAPSDANVVYVGTGEANIRGNVSPGTGIYRSTDAGQTWQHVWKQIGQIGTMTVHPKNADIAFAAVLGQAFGPNPERGVYRTTDGGKTWKNVLFKNVDTGCSDVVIDPVNPRIILAGFWETRRRPWDMTSGGPGSDLFISKDGGDTWTSLKTDKSGLPAGVWGKVGVSISPANHHRLFALIEHEKGGLFRSDDGGETWTLTSDSRPLRQRAWYYQTITPHPTNPDVVYCPNVQLLRSIDGGKNFGAVRGPHHGDHHDLWIDPINPLRMINGNDGGIDISTDGGKSWFAPPLPITQFYHVSADNRLPYHIMGCMQDLGSAAGPSNALKSRISLGDWYPVGGGEAGYAVPDPSDPNIVYAGEYGGIMTRYDHRTRTARNVTVNQWNPSGIDPAKHKFRFQWTAPILVSIHDPKTVYHAGNVLFRTRDGGQNWEPASPDLSRNDKQKQQWSGGPITGDNTGAETYCTIFAIAESPKQKGLLWAGTDDGLVHVSTDDAKTWTNLTANIPELPDWGTVKCIEPSAHDVNTAYLVVDNHRMNDYRPHLWKTTDLGKTWTKIVTGLDPAVHTHVLREDPTKKGLLYL
ncbi:MAG: VPS10 domain-containing protein, partial [Gemmataceae bacterium]